MIKSLLLAAALLLLTVGLTHAQTCVQADLSHPLSVSASWLDNSNDETGFVLERKLNGGTYSVVAASIAANITSYVDSTVVRAVAPNTYTYRLKAIKTAADGSVVSSPYTSEACVTFAALPPTPPNAPSGFTLAALTTGSVQASWSDNSDNEKNFVLQVASFAPKSNITKTLPADTTSFILTGLKSKKTFCGSVYGTNDSGNSDSTNQSCATTK